MSSKPVRLAIINHDKCRPKKCNHECKRICPINKQGKQCVEIENTAIISEDMCIGCGMCVKVCPFDAIQIVNLPTELKDQLVYTYGENCFRLYKLPIPKMGSIVGFIGQNGIGKSTLMNILSGGNKPNFGDYENSIDEKLIFDRVKGTELQKYFELLYNQKLVVKIKPQNIDKMLRGVKKKSPDIKVRDLLKKHLNLENDWHKKVMDVLELEKLLKERVSTLSGGEFQRLACAVVLIQPADVYIFDEPTNYLDVKQRLKVATLIRGLTESNEKCYVFIVEHDLSVLDYTSDHICIMYGTPGAYGVIATPASTARGINMFFDGYIPSDNVKFRSESYSFKEKLAIEYDKDETNRTGLIEYDDGQVDFGNFKLEITSGRFNLSSMIILLGQNGSGKTTFLNYLAKNLNFAISYKPQYLDVSRFIENGSYPTVYSFLSNRIKKSLLSNMFVSDVINPLGISKMYDKSINKLSGGELQRVMIAYCLGTEANIYLIDEPSASLDIEQRVTVTRVIKRFLIHNKKSGFIVEHDIMMAMSMSMEKESKVVVFDISTLDDGTRISRVSRPTEFSEGMNRFLKQLDVTFRTDRLTKRPRINKKDSSRDTEQKYKNKYYM